MFYINEELNLHANELLQTIQLPSKDYPVPEYLNLLPNALREYRSGSHQGIDFAIPLNGPIMAVSEGIIVRSNPTHSDVDIDTYNAFLETTQQLSKTPEDIYKTHLEPSRQVKFCCCCCCCRFGVLANIFYHGMYMRAYATNIYTHNM